MFSLNRYAGNGILLTTLGLGSFLPANNFTASNTEDFIVITVKWDLHFSTPPISIARLIIGNS